MYVYMYIYILNMYIVVRFFFDNNLFTQIVERMLAHSACHNREIQ